MDLQFLGATGTVTGSKYLLRHAGASVLVDCGLFQGYKQLRLRNWAPFPVKPSTIDAVILTHAHIDHSGYLPVLARNGFRGRVYCTHATRELCGILLPDSGHLQEEEAAYANRHGFSRHRPALPLYTRDDAEKCLRLFHPVDSHHAWKPAQGLHATLSSSGHMLGSSFVRMDDGHRSILFSGDLGRPDDFVLPPPEAPPQADFLVMESTYGDRLHRRDDVLADLAALINRTAARGGVVLIPSFAVGRAQSLMYCIQVLKDRKTIPALPVFLDSPMAANATAIYQRFPREHKLASGIADAMFRNTQIIGTPDESRALGSKHVPMVIISASGMATGGRVVHHLKALAPDRRNTVLFAGYQAGGTRGAALVAGARTVRIHGEDVPVRAEVAVLEQLSAHADAEEIVGWMRGFQRPPRQTFITHGEPAASDALRQRIERELGWVCSVPEHFQTIPLD
jgi:metallo-beta-lactamase family protein